MQHIKGNLCSMLVNECFISFQGEFPAGIPAYFIRLQGCNRACSFCDTRYAQSLEGGTTESCDDLIDAICESGLQDVVITGGEPLLQIEELTQLLNKLIYYGLHIWIETNGDFYREVQPKHAEMLVRSNITFIVSPKDIKVADWWIRHPVIIKFVVPNVLDIAEFVNWFNQIDKCCRIEAKILLMPLTDPDEEPVKVMKKQEKLIASILESGLPFGFAPRMQKVLNFR